MVHLILPRQCKAARMLLGWSQSDLSRTAGVSLSTLKDFETGRRTPHDYSQRKIETALANRGIKFFYNGPDSFGVSM